MRSSDMPFREDSFPSTIHADSLLQKLPDKSPVFSRPRLGRLGVLCQSGPLRM
jgi:hypothetical protein